MTAPRLRRPTRALGFPLLAVTLAVSSLLVLFGGCGLSTSGIPSGTGGGSACTSASQCDDGNACTTDACGQGGICTHTALADGPLPAAQQTPGDCQVLVCTGGMPMTQADNTDVPPTTNPCVKEECSGGMPLQDMTANNGATCTAGTDPGTCSDGNCSVKCTQASDCMDSNPCHIPNCDGATGLCSSTNVPDGTPTPGVAPVTGDCVVHLCVGGTDTAEDDDGDVPPIPMGEAGCADQVCTNGVPSNPLHGVNSVCSTFMTNMPGYCDAAGNCVACAADTDCQGTTNDCEHPACLNNVCGTAYTANGTPTTTTPAQTVGDCHEVVCDGNGGTTSIVNQNDPPAANACNTYACDANGNPTDTIQPTSTQCGTSTTGAAEFCNSAGLCGCQSQADCPAATCDGSATVVTLAQSCTGLVCVTPSPATHDCTPFLCSNGACTTTCSADNQCATGAYCNAGHQCTPQLGTGTACTAGDQCQSGFCADNVCCTTACTGITCEACSAAKKGQGSDGTCGAVKSGNADPHGACSNMGASSCGQTGVCNGSGACTLYSAGTVCQAATCNGTVLTKADTCNGTGTCTMPSPTTQDCTPFLCTAGACTTSCTMDNQCVSTAYCFTGTGANHDKCLPKIGNGLSGCSAADQCSSGTCGSNGVCCSGTCSVMNPPCGQTLACATGTGACMNAASGTTCSKVVSCTGNMLTTDTQCDGNGSCSSGSSMTPCPGNAICSGATTCNNGCGTNDGLCLSGNYCASGGGGTCKPQGAPGATCMAPDQCQSGVCGTTGTGNCCSAACTGGSPCGATSCNGSGACVYPTSACGAATCSGILFTPANAGTCNMGACMPGSGNNCSNNFACMGSTCSGTCTSNGSGLTAFCAPNYTCNASGNACLLSNGQPCGSGGQCVSNHCNTNCCTNACSVGGPCGSPGCDSGGGCNYPTGACSGTPTCMNGNQVSTPTMCSSGNCTANPSVTTCSGSLVCVSTASPPGCGCGTNDPIGDANCPAGDYCDGTSNGNAGACQTQGGTGAPCTRPGECASPLTCIALFCG